MFNKQLFSLYKHSSISSFSKFSLYKQTYSKFGVINLVTRDGVINRSTTNDGDLNISLNWQLGKVWVNPQNGVKHNSLKASGTGFFSGSSASSDTDIATKCSLLEFERFMRKMGIVMSKEKIVYVQDGSYNDKKVRIISSDSSDAELASTLFTGEAETNDATPVAHILFLTQHPEIGKTRKFTFWDDKRKILLSNCGNMTAIKDKLDSFIIPKCKLSCFSYFWVLS